MKYVLYGSEVADGQSGLFRIQEAEYTPSGLAELEALGRNTHGSFITTEKSDDNPACVGGEVASSLMENTIFPRPSFVYPAGCETQACFGAANGVWCTWTIFDNVLGSIYPHNSREAAEQMCYDMIKGFQTVGVMQ